MQARGIAAVFLTAAVLAGPVAGDSVVSRKVVAFASKQRGKKVGDGECAALAVAALRAAGAKSQDDFKPSPGPRDYVWGKAIVVIRPGKPLPLHGPGPEPGDILQFGQAEFHSETYTASAPQHTAIVLRVSKDRRRVTLLHQNWGGKRVVTELTLVLTDLRKGWVRVYRPVAARAARGDSG